MRKLSIEIGDIADKKACISAIRQLFAALEAQHGEKEARNIWRKNDDLQAPRWQARQKLSRALQGMENGDKRLILEYYAMKAPSKEGLAKALASRNVTLHKEWREWKAAQNKWIDENREDLLQRQQVFDLYHKTGQLAPYPSIPLEPRSPSGLFGSRGTTDWQTMLQQIKRIFRKHPEACAAVGEVPTEIREEEHSRVEGVCSTETEMQIRGHRRMRVFSRGTKRKR